MLKYQVRWSAESLWENCYTMADAGAFVASCRPTAGDEFTVRHLDSRTVLFSVRKGRSGAWSISDPLYRGFLRLI